MDLIGMPCCPSTAEICQHVICDNGCFTHTASQQRMAVRFWICAVFKSMGSSMQVPVADTVGCGDSFAAAVVMCYTRGHSIPAMLALANAVGAATAMGKGAGAFPALAAFCPGCSLMAAFFLSPCPLHMRRTTSDAFNCRPGQAEHQC